MMAKEMDSPHAIPQIQTQRMKIANIFKFGNEENGSTANLSN